MGEAAGAVVCWFSVLFVLVLVELCNGGITSSFVRKVEKTVDMPSQSDVFRAPPGYNAPQQVHITQGDHVGRAVIVSWVTMHEPGSNSVLYWTENSKQKNKAEGILTTYKFHNYTSGYIHHCTIQNLKFNTKYYYAVGIGVGHTSRIFWFTTPPKVGPDVPYTFGVIGDLGQSYDSNKTLNHYESNPTKGKAVLFVGDLSYADNYPNHDNERWDTWARFVERSVAYQPWIWTAGNHEIDFAPEIGEDIPFKPYTHRYYVPYKASKSTSPLWYSIKRASAYIIVLSSYSAYGMYTPQYEWLNAELPKVNRRETPWLIVLTHSPWYNSYSYHYMEGETMRVMFEPWDSTTVGLLKVRETYPFGVDPAWYGSRSELPFLNSLKMKMSILLGVAQMNLGIMMSFFNALFFQNCVNVWFMFIPQMIFLNGLFGYLSLLIIVKWCTGSKADLYHVMIYMFLGPTDDLGENQLFPGQKTLQQVLLLLSLVAVPWMLLPKPFILKAQHKKRHQGQSYTPLQDTDESLQLEGNNDPHDHEEFEFSEVFVHQLIHTIEFVLGAVSNTASYLRLWALSLAHSELSTVFYEKVLLLAWGYNNVLILIVGIIVFIFATVGVLLVMETLSAFLHALRLHWVEFQNKFYEGDGYKFYPFSFALIGDEEE